MSTTRYVIYFNLSHSVYPPCFGGGKATGFDNHSSYFLKTAGSSISPSLAKIFNPILSPGIFPDLWKTANVSPPHEDGSWFDRSNFRTMSFLLMFSLVSGATVKDLLLELPTDINSTMFADYYFCSRAFYFFR